MALHYCKKCGRVVERESNRAGYRNDTCDYCNSKVYPVPEKYWLDGLDFLITNDMKKLLREELVKTSQEFDEYLFTHRECDLAQRTAQIDAALAHGKEILEGKDKRNTFNIQCPYCHATNIKKISVSSKVVHALTLGLFSVSRNSKQWHCNHCGSDF